MLIPTQGEPDKIETGSLRKSFSQTDRSSYFQGVQLMACYESYPGNPIFAFTLAMLFENANMSNSNIRLRKWLRNYIEPFAERAPRDQSDQVEKIIAIATYLLISYKNDLQVEFPEGGLLEYIKYAHSESWLNAPDLAFCCSFLKDSIQACESTTIFFTTNLETYLVKRNAAAVSQAILVAHNEITIFERERCYELIRTVVNDETTLAHLAWSFMALTYSKIRDDLDLVQKLANRIDRSLTHALNDWAKEARLPGVMALLMSGADVTEMQEYLEAVSEQSQIQKNDVQMTDGVLTLTFTMGQTMSEVVFPDIPVSEFPVISDMGLCLLALSATRNHELIGVPRFEEGRLLSVIDKSELIDAGAVVVSKNENIAAGALTIIAILIVTTGILSYSLGYRVSPPTDTVETNTVGAVITFIASGTYIFWVFQALRSGRSAIRALLNIPGVKQFFLSDK